MGLGVLRASLLALGISSIIAVLLINPFFSAVISSVISGESSLVIILPEPAEIFNRSLDNYTYYAEIWAIVPEGIIELVKTKVGPGVPMIKLTIKDLRDIVSKWLEFYRVYGKYWRPSLVIQFSTYDLNNRSSILAFGASIVYDPEIFISPIAKTEVHRLSLREFPLVKRFEARNQSNAEVSFASCNITLQGLPPPCASPYDCGCCMSDGSFPYFTRLALGEKIFDSSDPSIPEALRDKVPLAILYLDPNTQTQSFGITYKAQNINKWIFRMTIFDRSSNITIWGDASGELTASVGSLTKVDISRRIGMIFWPGSFKLYTAYGYTCCYQRLCTGQGDIAITCDPNGFPALLMVVTYVNPALTSREFTLNEAPLDISYFRSKLIFSHYYVPAGSYVSIQRDPYELRINVVNIIMAIILSRLNIPWQQDVLLSIAAGYMPIAVELVGSQGMQEILELYNTGLYPATAYVARLRAVYIDPTRSPETFTPLFVDVR